MVESMVKKKYGTESMLKDAGGSSRQACEQRKQAIKRPGNALKLQ